MIDDALSREMPGEIQRGCFDRLLRRGYPCQGQPMDLSLRTGCCLRMQPRRRKARSDAEARGPLRHSSRCEVGVPLKLSGCAPCPGGPGHGLKALILHAFARQAVELHVLHRAKARVHVRRFKKPLGTDPQRAGFPRARGQPVPGHGDPPALSAGAAASAKCTKRWLAGYCFPDFLARRSIHARAARASAASWSPSPIK